MTAEHGRHELLAALHQTRYGMSKLTEQEKEKFEQIESGIREESEKMQEILVAIQESWSDPGTELFYKELIRNIHMHRN